jgi:hypothetical protein
MTARQGTNRRIGNEFHTGERPEKFAATGAGYFECNAIISTKNVATGNGPQGVKVFGC